MCPGLLSFMLITHVDASKCLFSFQFVKVMVDQMTSLLETNTRRDAVGWAKGLPSMAIPNVDGHSN